MLLVHWQAGEQVTEPLPFETLRLQILFCATKMMIEMI